MNTGLSLNKLMSWTIVIVVVIFVLQNPEQAALICRALFAGLQSAAGAVGTFIETLGADVVPPSP